MLDLHFIRENLTRVEAELKKKHYVFDVAQFKRLDAARKQADTAEQTLLAQRNQAAKQIGELIRTGKTVEQAKQTVDDTLRVIETQLADLKNQAKQAHQALDDFLLGLPNLPADEVPVGDSEADNCEVAQWGEPPNFSFAAKDHVELASALGGLDLDLASKITGSRFAVMRGNIARLHRALTQWMLNIHTREHDYQEVYVPYIVNADALCGTGQLPKFADDAFQLANESHYYLIPTAEVPVTNMVRERIIEEKELGDGLRFATHTPCFRREAGSYGRDTRGIIRQHQFEKVELVQLVRASDAEAAWHALTGHAEHILQSLQLPYRKVLLCGGDLGFAARRTYDLEVWLPSQQCYREISSCSDFGDFQARRMEARWRNRVTSKPEYLHSINGSGLAVGRTLVAVLENYQTASGSVRVPEPLVSYMGGVKEIH